MEKSQNKKGLLTSFFAGVFDTSHGEKYSKIIKYFIPEFISALVLYSLLYLADAYFIADLKSTATYATLGVTNTFMHYIVKFFEGIQVGGLILIGKYNGAKNYKEAGKTLTDALWVSAIVGLVVSVVIFFGAYWIYYILGVPEDMIHLGVPYLRIVASRIFFMSIYLTLVGFMKGTKDTKTPMIIFSIGAAIFIILDYILIYGKFGLPVMGFNGSAIASLVQYIFMFAMSLIAIVISRKNKIYEINLLAPFKSFSKVIQLVRLSIPSIIDKSTVALCYLWLFKMLAPMGKIALATFAVVKDFERLSLTPAVALASVVTLIVSNDYGRRDWDAIKSNAKKILFLGAFLVSIALIFIALFPACFVSIFDKAGEFTVFAIAVIPVLSALVIFDVMQLILSGAMRGSANVKTVMVTRLIVALLFFVPVTYLFSNMNIESQTLKFMLVYGTFYMGNLIMATVYMIRFRGEKWKTLDQVDLKK